MGVEQEFLRSYPAAILSYKKAVNFAERHLGADDGITQNLRNVYENAKNELDLTVFKKKKATTTSSGNMAAGVKASKYYAGGAQKQKKQVVQKQPEAYDNMITPRNVRTLLFNYNQQSIDKMERVDEADEEFHGHDATQEEHKVSNE